MRSFEFATFANGARSCLCRYHGHFANDRRHGQGVYKWKNGDECEQTAPPTVRCWPQCVIGSPRPMGQWLYAWARPVLVGKRRSIRRQLERRQDERHWHQDEYDFLNLVRLVLMPSCCSQWRAGTSSLVIGRTTGPTARASRTSLGEHIQIKYSAYCLVSHTAAIGMLASTRTTSGKGTVST